jgi:2'-5' RNA ligase
VAYVKPQNIHITLKFLGEIDEARLADVKDIMSDFCRWEKPFAVEIGRSGAFPGPQHPRILWVDVKDDRRALARITASLETALEKIDIAKDPKPFSPHITIGRGRSAPNVRKLSEKLAAGRRAPNLSVMIEEIVLYKSTLTPDGAVYEPLFKTPLQRTE